MTLVALSDGNRLMFEISGAEENIDEAIDAAREARSISALSTANRSAALSCLCAALSRKSVRSGSHLEADEAVEVGREALAGIAKRSFTAAASGVMANVGLALRTRFELGGQAGDLSDSISLLQQSLREQPDSLSRGRRLGHLAISLLQRYLSVGAIEDLNRSIEYGDEASLTTFTSDFEVAAILDHVANAHLTRFHRSGELEDLSSSIKLYRAAVTKCPREIVQRSTYRANLGLALRLRFEKFQERADLEEAFIEIIAAGKDGNFESTAGAMYAGLCSLWQLRYGISNEVADLNQALQAANYGLKMTTEVHPDRANLWHELGNCHQLRFLESQQSVDAKRAIQAFRLAACQEVSRTDIRILAAHKWAVLANASPELSESAADGYATVVKLLPLLAWRGVGREDQQKLLTNERGLGCDAAASALTVDRVGEAVTLLELGRAILWSQMLEIRIDLSLIMDADTDLGLALIRVRDELERLENFSLVESKGKRLS